MLTFEKVLEVFSDFLEHDIETEVVLTRHGYTVMSWNEEDEDWIFVTYCGTSKKLMETLASNYSNLLEYELDKGDRDLTDQEQAEIDAKIALLVKKCEEDSQGFSI